MTNGACSRTCTGVPPAERGQATVLLVGVLAAVLAGAVVLGAVAQGLGERGDRQAQADLAALAAARAMRAAGPNGLGRAAYLRIGRRAALAAARANGASDVVVGFPGAGAAAPVRVRVDVRDPLRLMGGLRISSPVSAEAALAPTGAADGGPGAYGGPLAYRQGKPMRPDTAVAFDRLAAAARAAGITLVVGRAFGAAAQPGDLHPLGTELDLGPPSAYPWLEANAGRFHFVRRAGHGPGEYGYVLNAGSAHVGLTYGSGDVAGAGGVSPALPVELAASVRRAAQRWNVSAALLSAQLQAEGVIRVPGAAGVPGAVVDARAHRMRDLLRDFGAVPLALAAYRAGSGPVAACGCVPEAAGTREYVARVLGLLDAGRGDGPAVRLVR